MLTAGTQAQSPFRFEEEHVAADQKDDADEQEDVHGKWSDLVNESGVGVVQLCGSCTVSGIRAVVECFYQDDGNGSSSMFSAVPPIVWSAFSVMAEKPSSRE